ncbi:L,D-transpeptidase family protein [Saccharomonospora sp. NPDC046836]|uniref:L,D-transpeptidase family protein n=1 Tax=Saccharomonospora sp. NPDC046836 TaxID=3156921 RepID=UPI0033CCCBC7
MGQRKPVRFGVLAATAFAVVPVLVGVGVSQLGSAEPRANAQTEVQPATTVAAPTTPKLPSAGELQRRLQQLGHQVREVTGTIDAETRHAIVAFQKVQGLPRTGEVDEATAEALDDPRAPVIRSAAAGFHIEVDLTTQVVYTVVDGVLDKIYDASTGQEPAKATPEGEFAILYQIDGMRYARLGPMYRPSYFTYDGVAFHGAEPVEPQPASNGCVRLTDPSVDELFGLLTPGTKVIVHRS